MQILSGNKLDKFNKISRFFHPGSNKIGFLVFRFFYNFLCILQVSEKSQILLKMLFCKKVPGGLDSLQIHPQFADWPLERFEVLQYGPRAVAAGGPAKFRRTGGRDRPGAGGGRPARSLSSILTEVWGGGGAGRVVRRRPPVPAAAACCPVKDELARDNTRRYKLG
jgi:hypothetical protein